MMLVSCLYPNQIYRDAGREDVPWPGMYPLLVFNPVTMLVDKTIYKTFLHNLHEKRVKFVLK